MNDGLIGPTGARAGRRAFRHGVVWMAALVALLVLPGMDRAAPPPSKQAPPGFEPTQLAQAYNFLPIYHKLGLRGGGQTIAFVEVDGVDTADLDHFDEAFSLPPAALDIYIPTDAAGPLAPGPETTMDVEWAHALAPAARLRVYEVTHAGDFSHYAQQLADAVEAAIQGGATVISLSLRGTGSILCSTFWASIPLRKPLTDAVARNISVFAASGDYGDRPCQTHHSIGTVYPAADPDVTAVGGTSLTLTADNAYRSETAWSGSGGGFNSDFKRPDWQRGPGTFDPRYRSVPDVAFVADPRTGALVFLQQQWVVAGGTSLGAPCWAALWALAQQYHLARTHKPLSAANPLLYALGRSPQRARIFHDITTGSNGHYSAGPGYDEVTGLGSPNAYALVQALTP